ncbi:MAG TPA: hypothetical protein PKV67_03305 [Hyphomonas sp.]|nr:hypothetical protein [Hyphomonas sp.]HRK67356.1 hypothetical protein [Hyphomonas sp.]
MLDVTIARAIHVAAIIHWIGGVFFVTLVLLPGVRKLAAPQDRARLFEKVEGAFSGQAKISVTLAGVTGLYMTQRLAAWERFLEPGYWWMHAMLAVWVAFTLVLFVFEPLFLHRWFADQIKSNPETAMILVWRGHLVLLALSAVTILASVLGAHGALY